LVRIEDAIAHHMAWTLEGEYTLVAAGLPASFTPPVSNRAEQQLMQGNIDASQPPAGKKKPSRRQLYQLALSLPAVDINRQKKETGDCETARLGETETGSRDWVRLRDDK